MKKILLLCFVAMASWSCAAIRESSASHNIEKNVRNIEIGMTEREVAQIIGDYFTVVGADRNTKELSFASYFFFFRDGRLESFYKRIPPPEPPAQHIYHHNEDDNDKQ